MNNNILNLINNIGETHNLSQTELQELTTKYQNDTRDIKIIEKELNNYANYYKYQNINNNIIKNTPQLTGDNNYYIMTFNSNGNTVLEGINLNIINPETQEVIINNNFKGTKKHTNVDDLEIAIFQIGTLLGFDIVEEYRIYNSNKEKDSIVIKDLVNNNEFYDVENLRKRFQKLISSGKIKKENWVDTYQSLTVANSKEDYESAIDYGLKILKVLPSILKEDYQAIEQKYFEMLLFDSIINQSERKFEDYGIICNKETRRYTFASLFDNVFPSILKNNDIFYLNGITCNRYELIEKLFNNHYDKIKDKIEYILSNKNKLLKNIDIIAKYNLDINTYSMLMDNVATNLNYFERLNNERKLPKNNNAGFADIFTMGMVLLIIIAFSIAIAYLIYCIK